MPANAQHDVSGGGLAAPSEGAARTVSLLSIFFTFMQVGSVAFGGGSTGWVYREVVLRRHWLVEEDFLSGLAIGQVLPGANVTNMAVYIGHRLRGVLGSIIAVTGLLTVPFFAVLGLSALYNQFAGMPTLQKAMDGVAAAALGLVLLIAWKAAQRIGRDVAGAIVLVATFIMVGLLHWPLLLVVIGLAPFSVAAAWPRKSANAE